MAKHRVLVIGATGHIGPRLVKASVALGHPTFLLYRAENASNFRKCQMFMEFKMDGAHLLQGSLDDHESLVSALKQVDVVISCVGSQGIRHQLNIIEAIKEVGTIKRFMPSEFGMDVDRLEHAIPPGDELFADKRMVHRAIEEANIPYTYVSANCLAGFFIAGLAQLANYIPPRDHVNIYGNGDRRCIWVDETDVATYTILGIDDPRTLNKILNIRPPGNILTQMELVQIWEKLIGQVLKKTFLNENQYLSLMDNASLYEQIGIAHLYQIYYCGDLDFEVEGPYGVDSSVLYPSHRYVSAEDYLKRFL